MSTNKIDDLSSKLNQLIRQHNNTHQEILKLKEEVLLLKKNPSLAEEKKTVSQVESTPSLVDEKASEEVKKSPRVIKPPVRKPKPASSPLKPERNLEEFIGGNLISKIGIAILVIGVGFLVKYAVDNGHMGPMVRVALGYLTGIALVVVAFFFKEKYKSYSAILLGGGLATLYISTYAAYAFYPELGVPKGMAFSLMLAFTGFGVFAAYRYNVQAIAIIGLAGAYAVPILLSDNTGNIRDMFIYVTIVNLGVLSLAFRKYWRILNYITFFLTWGVFLAWYGDRFNYEEHFGLAMLFASIFFLTFYGVLLAYKLVHQEEYSLKDVSFLLVNSFIYFGVGYHIIEQIPNGEKWLGLFAISNALIHLGVALVIRQRKLADKNLFFLVAGLVLTFLTLTFPIQLDGNWVTLIWIAEAVLVFWIGRSQKVFFYEALSYVLAGLSFFSLFHDWGEGYASSVYAAELTTLTPLFNIHFFTSVFVIAGLAAIFWMRNKYEEVEIEAKWNWIKNFGNIALPAFLLISTFFAFWLEMNHYSFQRMAQTVVEIEGVTYFNNQISQIRELWQFNYGLIFFAGLLFLNDRFWKSNGIRLVGLGLTGLFVMFFLIQGIAFLAELRDNYLFTPAEHFNPMGIGIGIRYISYVVIAGALYIAYKNLTKYYPTTTLAKNAKVIIHFVVLVLLSDELLNLSDIFFNPENDAMITSKVRRVGFSVLWGLYSLFLIGLGIWKKDKILRFAGIGLFAITLAKVFLFDLANTSIASKTVIFMALGVLLLIISFLYQRYKHIILGEEETPTPIEETQEDE